MKLRKLGLPLAWLTWIGMLVLTIRLADYARAMRESRDAWRDHHRTLVGASDDGGGDWPYWRAQAAIER